MPRQTAAPLILTPPADFRTLHPQIVSLARQLSLKYMHRYVVTEEDLQTLGTVLWYTLEADADLAVARRAAGNRILPIIIESAEPLVQFLPWECLYHPEHGFLGKHPGFTLSRRLEPTAPAVGSLPRGPLQVLLFTALPDDLDPEKERLDVESEQANVLEALDPLIQAGKVVLTTPDDGRFGFFKQLLREKSFQLVFLSGHGTFREKESGGEADTAWFLFEGEDGRSEPVEGKALARAFPGTGVQGVVLSACESGKSASDALSTGLAARLLEAGLPHVVGMRESILDVAGTRFAQALCKALGREERLDVALQEARETISEPLAEGEGRWRDAAKAGKLELTRGQWCLPLLYSREAARPLIDWQFQPVPPEPLLLRYEEIAGIPLPRTFIGRRLYQALGGNFRGFSEPKGTTTRL